MEAKQFYEQHGALMKNFDVTLSQMKDYEKRFDEMEDVIKTLQTKDNRPAIPSERPETRTEGPFDAEMRHFARTGEINLDNVKDDEVRALYQADQTTGGYFAQTEWVNELLRNIVLYSEIAGSVGTRNTSATSIEQPFYDHTFAAQWTGAEKATKTETTGQMFGMKQITTHELYALIDISQKDLEDSRFDLEGYMMREFALQFAVAEAMAILYGNGAGQPNGILDGVISSGTTLTGGSAGLWGGAITSAQDVALDPNNFKDLYWSLLPQYSQMPGAAFVMHQGTVQTLDEFRGVNEKQYIWQPGLNNDPFKTALMGHQIVLAPEMPFGTGASNSLGSSVLTPTYGRGLPVAIYGNLQRGYLLVNRIDTQILRDPYTQATSGLIRFIARRRVGGMVILPEALKVLTLHS
jgi:HK97 family phage major capsid protein